MRYLYDSGSSAKYSMEVSYIATNIVVTKSECQRKKKGDFDSEQNKMEQKNSNAANIICNTGSTTGIPMYPAGICRRYNPSMPECVDIQ